MQSSRTLHTEIMPNLLKLRELILYISARSADDPKFGRTKLLKLLFYSDFHAFAQLRKPITGVKYTAMEDGPVPKRIYPLLQEMEEQGEIRIDSYYRGNFETLKTTALREPNLVRFSRQELEIVDNYLNEFRDDDGSAVSDRSHGFAGWIAARELEEAIPYETVDIVNTPAITQRDLERVSKLENIAERMGFGAQASS